MHVHFRRLLDLSLWLLPLFWLASVLVGAVPRCLYAIARQGQIVWLEPSFEGLRVTSRLADGSVLYGPPLWMRILVPLLLMAAVAVLGRRHVILPGLLFVALGRAAATNLLDFRFGGSDPLATAALVVFILIAAVGLGWLVRAQTYWWRLAEAALILTIPVVLYYGIVIASTGSWRILRFLGFALAIELVPMILIGAIGWRRRQDLHFPALWRSAAFATLVLAIVLGGSAVARQLKASRLDEQISSVQVKVPVPAAYPKSFFQRGISLVDDGFEAYYPEPTGQLLDTFRTFHIDSVALIPYGYTEAHEPEIHFEPSTATARQYDSLLKVAHARGIKVLLKPQLMVPPTWFPGSIEITDAQARRQWFASYTKFIEYWAHIAANSHADLFCIGTELEKMTKYESEWREIARRVRAIYAGPIVYAAVQGPEFEGIRWWDAVDYIGLNNYYPLPDSLDTSDLVGRVEKIHRQFDRPVLFTELGYASVDGSHREPWAEPQRPVNLDHQARCYEAIFKAFYDKPWFYGMYWWKVSADGRGGPNDRSLTPWRKPAMDVLGRWYAHAR